MSFSKDVKKELSKNIPKGRHCQIAEISAILSMCGQVNVRPDRGYEIIIHTENFIVAHTFMKLVYEAFHFKCEVNIRTVRMCSGVYSYWVVIWEKETAQKILQAAKLLDEQGCPGAELELMDENVIQQTCCKRAYIRGAFLCAGSMSTPEKTYHFEIVCMTEQKAALLKRILETFQIEAKIVMRKKYYVLYLKDAEMIVDTLNVMEAPLGLMQFENVRILKEMRNSVNRRVNCETANISKTVSAAVRQIEDICYIRDTVGLGILSKPLKDVALLRLKEPDLPLKDLGKMLDPPVGKSGVNHRLRKISDFAAKLREENVEDEENVKK